MTDKKVFTTKEKIRSMAGWSLLTSALIAAFWAIWYLIKGSVPVDSELHLAKDLVVSLPFPISRWWDVLLGPTFSIMVILIITGKRYCGSSDNVQGLIWFGFIFALVGGLSGAFAFGPIGSLIFGFICGSVYGGVEGIVLLLLLLVELLANWCYPDERSGDKKTEA